MSSSAHAARRVLAVSFLAGLSALATACSSGSGAAAPTSTVTVTQAPVSSPASGPASTPATAPSPTATAPAPPAQCTTADLRVHVGSSQGAAGTIYYFIDFTNVSGSTCVVQGYPGVSLVSRGSTAGSQIGADAKRSSPAAVKLITLAQGQTGHAMLGIAEAGAFPPSSCHPVTAHWLKVFPPDQTVAAYVSFTTQTCASTSQPTMHISAISSGA
jgi:Protein of unknown function (DUF4232)